MAFSNFPEIKPVHNPIYTTSTSLEDVVIEAIHELEDSQMTPNRLRVLFGIYHNTLIMLSEQQQLHRA